MGVDFPFFAGVRWKISHLPSYPAHALSRGVSPDGGLLELSGVVRGRRSKKIEMAEEAKSQANLA